jgi:hypothetical protein
MQNLKKMIEKISDILKELQKIQAVKVISYLFLKKDYKKINMIN